MSMLTQTRETGAHSRAPAHILASKTILNYNITEVRFIRTEKRDVRVLYPNLSCEERSVSLCKLDQEILKRDELSIISYQLFVNDFLGCRGGMNRLLHGGCEEMS